MNEQNGISSRMLFFASFVSGLLGAATGLLLAPQAGRKSREQLQEAYEQVVGQVNDFVKMVDDTLPDVVNKVKDFQNVPSKIKNEVTDIKKEAVERFDKVVEKGTSYLNDVKGVVTSSVEEGKKTYAKERKKLSGKKEADDNKNGGSKD